MVWDNSAFFGWRWRRDLYGGGVSVLTTGCSVVWRY